MSKHKRPRDETAVNEANKRIAKRARQEEEYALKGAGTDYAGQLSPCSAAVPFLKQHVKRIKGAAAGAAHSIVLTEDGKLVSFGSNDTGALGRSSTLVLGWVDEFGPESKIVCAEIACGDAHSVALDSRGRVWTWGCYHDTMLGQIGYNADLDVSFVPRLVTCSGLGEQRIVSISAGENHVLARTSQAFVYQWGAPLTPPASVAESKEETLKRAKALLTPRCVPIVLDEDDSEQRRLARVSHIWTAGKQNFVRIDDHDPKHHLTVWAWGLNNYGQLATHESFDSFVVKPILCTALHALCPNNVWLVIQIVGGPHHAMALLARYDGEETSSTTRVCTWGRTHYGRLGRQIVPSSDHWVPPADITSLPKDKLVKCLAANEAHSFALLENGQLYGWGLDTSNQLGRTSSETDETNESNDEMLTPVAVMQDAWPVRCVSTAAQHTLVVHR